MRQHPRHFFVAIGLGSLFGLVPLGASGLDVSEEAFHLSWINRVAMSELFEVGEKTYQVNYLPVGVPYMQSRANDGFLNPAAVLEPGIWDSGVRTLEISRAYTGQFWPADETEAFSVARQFCEAHGGWPVVAAEVEATAMGKESDQEFSYWDAVSFSHGTFRIPEICYAE